MDYLTINQLENMFHLIYSEETIEDLEEDKYYIAEINIDENEYDYYFIKIIQITEEKIYSSGCYVKQPNGWVIDQEYDYINNMHKDCMDFIKFYSF